MARIDIINMMYSRNKSPLEFKYDNLSATPLFYLISPEDVYELNKIAKSIKYSSNPKKKYSMIDNILKPRGFKKLASGTNRVVYKYLNDQSIVLKVALDKVGLKDNPNEYYNQEYLKPFVTKCFEISNCGTVGLFERVHPITSRKEFISIAEDVYDLIVQKLIGKYVLEDIGTKYFMNWGLRSGFGPVLLDYPYMFELDGNKLYCNNSDLNNPKLKCGGVIDYDAGFNNLICEKCGKKYLATELRKYKQENKILIKDEGVTDMKISIKKGNKIIKTYNETSSNTYDYSKKNKRNMGNNMRSFYYKNQKIENPIKVSIVSGDINANNKVLDIMDYDNLNNIYKKEQSDYLKVKIKSDEDIKNKDLTKSENNKLSEKFYNQTVTSDDLKSKDEFLSSINIHNEIDSEINEYISKSGKLKITINKNDDHSDLENIEEDHKKDITIINDTDEEKQKVIDSY